jgi:hypothetical protein
VLAVEFVWNRFLFQACRTAWRLERGPLDISAEDFSIYMMN